MTQDFNASARVGLCASCKHVRLVRSDRGSVFYQCKLAATDSRFSQYPALPVLVCIGFEKGGPQVPPVDSPNPQS